MHAWQIFGFSYRIHYTAIVITIASASEKYLKAKTAELVPPPARQTRCLTIGTVTWRRFTICTKATHICYVRFVLSSDLEMLWPLMDKSCSAYLYRHLPEYLLQMLRVCARARMDEYAFLYFVLPTIKDLICAAGHSY
jgi:hypothetical protein